MFIRETKNQDNMVKIIKGGFVIHSVVRENFPEGLTFKPRPRQPGVRSEGSGVGCEKSRKGQAVLV